MFGSPLTNAYTSLIAQGLLVTLVLSTVALSLAAALGFVLGAVRAAKVPVLDRVVGVYVLIFRSVPVLIQLFLVFYGVPVLFGIDLPPIPSAITALALYEGAYMTEIVRAGIESLPRGQTDAANALGLSYLASMRYVVIPQALRVMIPPGIGLLVGGIKDSSLASIIGVMDVTGAALVVRANTLSNWDVFAVLSVLYFGVCSVVSLAGARAERFLGREELLTAAPTQPGGSASLRGHDSARAS